MLWLAVFFFGIALCYSSVGFGGGSSYTALLAAKGESAETIRQISLLCNVIVVLIGGIAGRANLNKRLIVPLLLGSLPGVWLGAGWRLSEGSFLIVLAVALTAAGLLLFVRVPESERVRVLSPGVLAGLGGALGMVAGMTGIGGGIYLAPVLVFLRAGKAKEIAAVATWFILLNSATGLAVITASNGTEVIENYLWLPVAVAAGGLIGARLLQGMFDEGLIRKITGVLILVVAVRLMMEVARCC